MTPQVAIFCYDFRTLKFRRLERDYYITKKERLGFRWGYGHYGMKKSRLGQFHLELPHAFMVVVKQDDLQFAKSEAHFWKCVARQTKRWVPVDARFKEDRKPPMTKVPTEYQLISYAAYQWWYNEFDQMHNAAVGSIITEDHKRAAAVAMGLMKAVERERKAKLPVPEEPKLVQKLRDAVRDCYKHPYNSAEMLNARHRLVLLSGQEGMETLLEYVRQLRACVP